MAVELLDPPPMAVELLDSPPIPPVAPAPLDADTEDEPTPKSVKSGSPRSSTQP
jgi:hypothetical protein